MARAKRHYIPGCIWHITHRCHKREFLLKFSRDRHRYLQWLYQARKRHGLTILNYMVTSNHGWVEEYLGNGEKGRQEGWTRSIAVGNRPIVEKVKALLGFRARGRKVIEGAEGYQVREGSARYRALFGAGFPPSLRSAHLL